MLQEVAALNLSNSYGNFYELGSFEKVYIYAPGDEYYQLRKNNISVFFGSISYCFALFW